MTSQIAYDVNKLQKCMKGYIHYVNESFAIKFMCDYRLISKKIFFYGNI